MSDEKFTPRARSDADLSLGGVGGGEDREQEARDRLSHALHELTVCLDDGRRISEMGRARLDDDWLVQRAARNVIAELGETVGRLPDQFRAEHPDVNWMAIAGMHNRTVHAHPLPGSQVVWDTLTVDFTQLRIALDRR